MFKRPLFAAATLAALLLAGCSTPTPATPASSPVAASTGAASAATATPPIPSSQAAPVPPIVIAEPATIKGSEESSALLDNFTAFIVAVDGQKIAAGRQGWDQPVSLKPGPHRLSVEFNRGVFLARTDIMIEAKSGAAYELRHASDAQVYGSHSYCEFWIVDLATGEKAAAAKRTELSNVKPAN